MKRICFIFLTLLTLSSCSYTYTLHFVDNNYQLKQANSTLNPEGSEVSNQSYNDEYLTIELLQVTNDCIFLTLVNNHTSTIRILWDEAAFVDFNGYSHRINHDNSAISKKLFDGLSISHSGGKRAFSTHLGKSIMIDESKVQIPSVLPAGSRVNTVIIPIGDAPIVKCPNIDDNAIEVYEDDDPKVKEDKLGKVEKRLNKCQAMTDETAIKLLLPIEVDGKKIEYTTTFMDEFQTCSEETEDIQDLVVLLVSLVFLPLLIFGL